MCCTATGQIIHIICVRFFFAGCESVGACFLICSIPMQIRVRFESCLVDVESHGRDGLMVWPYLARGHTCCVRRRWARCIRSLAEKLFFFFGSFSFISDKSGWSENNAAATSSESLTEGSNMFGKNVF